MSPGVHQRMHFKQKYELVEAYNKVRRLQEEQGLLVREQKSYLSFYEACQRDLKSRIQSWEEQVTNHDEEESSPDHARPSSVLEVIEKYFVVDFDIASESELMQGTIAKLWEAFYEAGEQHNKGYRHFQVEAGGLGLAWPKRGKDSTALELESTSSDSFDELDPEDAFNDVE